ncbi:MAG: hypothetical protein H6668_01095 [Ardenticatenaceae bacterium]|nr:hypothetical protein [Ardenticatenaceae bacterium]
MTGQPGFVSPALAAAQAQLNALRQQHSQMVGVETAVSANSQQPTDDGLQPTAATIAQLPEHLGWGSAALTAVLRPKTTNHEPRTTDASHTPHPTPHSPLPAAPAATSPTITLYPTLTLAMLRQKRVPAGRVWLLLRHIDEAGRGWVWESEARRQLAEPGSELQICGWRQLRNLLGQGDGVFWQRENGRLWLRNPAKVAAALGVERLNGRCATLPLDMLTQPIGTVRAHFYASFHSARPQAPIARATLTQLSGRQRQTQRQYEAKTRIQSRVNIALGQRLTDQAREETAWQQGNAAFVLRDRKGKYGPKNTTYLAWRLPNSYQGPHATARKSRQKRLNRQLADLLTDGTTGNGRCQRRYGVLGKQRHANYWIAPATSNQPTQIWFSANG